MTRLVLVLGCVVLFVLVLLGMRLGWRNRARRQAALPPLPPLPGSLGSELVTPLTGLYVGSTTATRWQDRIVAHGLGERADCTARLGTAGVLIERQGSAPVFIPDEALLDARLEPALAGKVVGRGGLLVLRWQHGEGLLDTGLRGDDKTVYPAWIRAIAEQRQETDAS
jgi:hypothetical protein